MVVKIGPFAIIGTIPNLIPRQRILALMWHGV